MENDYSVKHIITKTILQIHTYKVKKTYKCQHKFLFSKSQFVTYSGIGWYGLLIKKNFMDPIKSKFINLT